MSVLAVRLAGVVVAAVGNHVICVIRSIAPVEILGPVVQWIVIPMQAEGEFIWARAPKRFKDQQMYLRRATRRNVDERVESPLPVGQREF
jgi:hypothetical protein